MENPVLTAALMVLIIIFLVLACAFVYMTTPGKFRFFELPVVFAHRGWFDNEEIPENSLGAFRKSAENDIAVELDVRPTKDNEIVVFHDKNVKRMTGEDRDIEEMTLEEIRALRLLGTEEGIPTFREAMEACNAVPIYCEIKTDTAEIKDGFLEKLYQEMLTYEGQMIAVSINPLVLRWFRDNHPEVIRGQLSAGMGHIGTSRIFEFAISNLLINFLSKPDFISYRFEDKSPGFHLCRFYGTRLVAWTVKSMDDVENAACEGYSSFVGEKFDMTEV